VSDPFDPTGSPGEHPEGGLPPEIEQLLRGLTGGGELDPNLVSMMREMGLGEIDPQVLSVVAGQVQAMFAGGPKSGVDEAAATDVARKVVASAGDPSVGPRDTADVAEAVHIAGLWLDEATDLPATDLHGAAWSRSEWVVATMPVWRELVEPVAEGVSDAVGASMSRQLGQLGEAQLPEGLVPPGVNPAEMLSQVGPMMRTMNSAMFSMQLGQAVGTLAGDVLTGNEVAVPLVAAPKVVLLPELVRSFAAGLEIDEPQARLYLALRESARAVLFAGVPWLGPQVLAAVRDYARDITIDTDGIEEAMRGLDPSSPEALQEALQGRLFAPKPSAAQTAALARLETLLALVEGWVDVVTEATAAKHLPQAAALGEAVRRRRASGGPAEKTFSTLVGLELRPRRLKDAANLFAALEASGGTAARDGAWAHPDVAPTVADLDDPLGYVERQTAGATDLDAELDALLRGDSGTEGTDGTDAPRRDT
jgi:putative hydrolase